jgi:hypothetical protein
MWDGADTEGLISCTVGTVLVFIRMFFSIFFLVYVIGGAVTLAMGVLAVRKGSKIGIGGAIIGAVLMIFLS